MSWLRRYKLIVAAAISVFAVAMLAIWVSATQIARARTMAALIESQGIFDGIVDKLVDMVLWHAGSMLEERFESASISALNLPSADVMQKLANEFYLDELNIVNSNGIVIASNIAKVLGHDFNDNVKTLEFLRELGPNGKSNVFSQDFRAGAANPESYCKYLGIAWTNRTGILQLGVKLHRLSETICYLRQQGCRRRIVVGKYGYFDIVDRDGDGESDLASSWPGGFPKEGVFDVIRDEKSGERLFVHIFEYAGLLYQSVISEREFYDQRNRYVLVSSLLFALFLSLACFFFIRLSNSSDKLAAMHAREERRNAADLSLAHQIQMSALPISNRFRLGAFDSALDAVTFPAREVGGDLYDFFETDDGRIALLVADASGKGVPAAMFMLIAKNCFQHFFSLAKDVAQCAEMANDYLCEHNTAEMFVTAFVALIDPKTGDVDYVNAGHNRPYVVGDGDVRQVNGKGGLFMGMFPHAAYRVNSFRLKPGERLLLYTDGVTEAMTMDKRVYGNARLEQFLAEHRNCKCADLKRDVDAFVDGNEPSDDLTLLSFAWYGEPERQVRDFACSPDSLSEAMEFLRQGVKLANRQKRLKLLNAVDEAMSNVVNYSGSARFQLAIDGLPDKCRIELTDGGVPFNPLTHVDPNTNASLADRPIGGLGILMAKRLVDMVTYDFERGENRLTLIQRDEEV